MRFSPTDRLDRREAETQCNCDLRHEFRYKPPLIAFIGIGVHVDDREARFDARDRRAEFDCLRNCLEIQTCVESRPALLESRTHRQEISQDPVDLLHRFRGETTIECP